MFPFLFRELPPSLFQNFQTASSLSLSTRARTQWLFFQCFPSEILATFFLMDFGLVSSLGRSNSATAASNNGGGHASETNTDANKLRFYGFSFLNKDDTAEDDLPPSKTARISPCGGDVPKFSSRESNNGGDSTQNLLSFSSPDLQLLSLSHNASVATFPFVSSSSGYICGGLNGPFTPSQWMELEHQALIYKYITANVPIPSYLLIPIRKALESSGLSCFSLLTPNARFHLGMSKSDPEPGRCRRTDGKKWRCSREAMADQKYCERHINRGRHRSRKPVEGHHQPTPAKTSCLYTELGSVVCSDSLPNGSSTKVGEERRSEWPKKQQAIEAGMSMGGPLGEALSIGSKGVSFCNGLMLPSLPAL